MIEVVQVLFVPQIAWWFEDEQGLNHGRSWKVFILQQYGLLQDEMDIVEQQQKMGTVGR